MGGAFDAFSYVVDVSSPLIINQSHSFAKHIRSFRAVSIVFEGLDTCFTHCAPQLVSRQLGVMLLCDADG